MNWCSGLELEKMEKKPVKGGGGLAGSGQCNNGFDVLAMTPKSNWSAAKLPPSQPELSLGLSLQSDVGPFCARTQAEAERRADLGYTFFRQASPTFAYLA